LYFDFSYRIVYEIRYNSNREMRLKHAVRMSPVVSHERTICAPPLSRPGVASEILVNIARLSANKAQTRRISNSRQQYDQSPTARYPSSSPRYSSYSTLSVAYLRLFVCLLRMPKAISCAIWLLYVPIEDANKMTHFLYFRNVKWLQVIQ